MIYWGPAVKNFEKPGKWKRHILPVLLLAAACVGTVELVVCAYQAPDVYAAITAPVRSLVRHAGQAGELVWAGLQQHTDRAVAEGVTRLQTGLRQLDDYLSRPPEPEPEPELAPELQEELQLVDGETDLAPPPRSRADYSITALLSRDGQQYLTGGSHNLVYYDQTAARWAEEPYGSDTIGRYGCGPTVMAMVVSTLTQTSIDPAEMARLCVDRGYWAKKHGSYWSIVPGIAEEYGLTCTSLPPEETDKEVILHHLSTGQLLVALVGPGHFTGGGHFILLRGLSMDGTILVADPASPDRSLTTWDLDLILEELSASRSSGGPLWAVSVAFTP